MCGAWGRSADGDLCHAVWASADSADRHPAQGLPCETICRRKRTHSLASVLLTSKIKGLPSALACSLQETHSQFGVGLADFEDKGLAIRVGVLAPGNALTVWRRSC